LHPNFRTSWHYLAQRSSLALLLLAFAGAAFADTPAPAPLPSPSSNFAVNLINRLVQRGALTKEDAAELLQLAQADTARVQAAVAPSSAPAPAVAAPPAAAAPPPDSDDTVRVTYIPESVKAQLRDEIKEEVMQQARTERWAAPRTFPDWVSRVTLFGDFRFRYEGEYLPKGNNNTGAFPNFNAINTGAPFDVSGTEFSPQNDVDQNRDRLRIRARLGVAVDLGNGFTSGFRMGTGENDSPVTENQSLGAANGAQGGNFSKYQLWLDRAFLKFEAGGQPDLDFTATVGRFDNPFLSTSMIWADDLGFDGAVVQGKYGIAEGVTPYLTVGAFPVFNTDFTFATNQPAKFPSEDKWLYAAQIGTRLKSGDFEANVAGAYYYFQNVEGRLSDPFTPLTSADQGDTDDTRPAFAQTGNTYMALRDIVPSALNDFGTIDQFQYFGLATPFHEAVADARIDYNHFDPFQVSLIGEWVDNIAFRRREIADKAVNNLGPDGGFAGGSEAWIVNLKLGQSVLLKNGDWNAAVGYRYVASDAMVDGFVDADFGGTMLGTNHKGYTLSFSYGLSPAVWAGIRWMSADSVAGPQFKDDLLLIDINSSF